MIRKVLRFGSSQSQNYLKRTTTLNTAISLRFNSGDAFLDKEQVTQRVINAVKRHEKADPNKVSASAHFANDLGMDSLDATEVVMEVENEFSIEIPDEEAFKFQSVEDVVNYISSNPMAK